jgi:hypothetical protein
MNLILNNPYRLLGLLVGATAKEQAKQINKLKMYLEAEQDPQDDFSFPTIGNLQINLYEVNEAAAKLNLDSDKMSSALFWFYKGNSITDEPAFDAIKEADLDQAISIWTKLTSKGEVSQRNASAFNNLATLYLSGILHGTNTNEALIEKGISLKLKFLESDFYTELQHLATDEKVYKPTKKDIQILFLKFIQSEIEKSGGITSNKLLDILTKQEFSAKEDFLKGFVQKPIEQIEKKIEESKSKRKANKANSIKAANSLLADTKDSIKQLKSILGATNIRYSSIADKLAMEFFACGRDYFMHFKDTDTDPSDYSMKLFKNAKSYAVGNIAKQQIDENIKDLQEWIDDKPERDKQKLIGEDIQFITSKLERFQNISDTVVNAKELVDSCKPKLANIKSILGSTDDFYLKISSAIIQNTQNMLVQAVNEELENPINVAIINFGLSTNSPLKETVIIALDTMFKIGTLDMITPLNNQYSKNLEGIKSIANQLKITTLTPKEKLQIELRQAESKIKEIQNSSFYKTEIDIAKQEMVKINEWKFLRSQSEKNKQINDQNLKINNLIKKSDQERKLQLDKQQSIIYKIKSKIKKAEY